MTIWAFSARLRRRLWWIIALPLVAGLLAAWLLPAAPYEVTVRATVLIPGDTENPGRAERPELMVLDDLGPMIESQAFARMVYGRLAPDSGIGLEDVQSALSGSRYSRIAQITVSGSDPSEVYAIAEGVELTFSSAVNTFLVGPEDTPAAVDIIDGAAKPQLQTKTWRLEVLAVTVVAGGLGLFVLWVVGSAELAAARQDQSTALQGTDAK